MFLWGKMDVEECLHRLAQVWRAKWERLETLGKQQTNNLPIDHGRDGCIFVPASSRLLRNVSKIYFRQGQSNFFSYPLPFGLIKRRLLVLTNLSP